MRTVLLTMMFGLALTGCDSAAYQKKADAQLKRNIERETVSLPALPIEEAAKRLQAMSLVVVLKPGTKGQTRAVDKAPDLTTVTNRMLEGTDMKVTWERGAAVIENKKPAARPATS